ncbi:Nodulin-like-domain-containing protein [Scenedesmus sp. NREL 46B-D3]|nr:Nodulin-like-domain-containing protein [Scenedesmus sp. NREL 46B-D3]
MASLPSTEAPYISKWVTFSASAVIQACAGLSYSFSVYAPTIKDTLGLTQTQIATVGSAVNLGGYFAIISGSVYDNLKGHHRLGPRLVLWMGCLSCFCGYTGLYLMASGKAPNNFPQLLVFAIAAGNSGTYFDTTTLVTNVRNFPNERGFVVGVLKSFLGLSSSVYTSMYVAFFEPDAVAFLLMLALLPTVLAALLSLGLNYVPYVEDSEACQHQQRLHQQQHAASSSSRWATTQGRFLLSFLMVGVLALYQMASAVLVGQHHLSSDGKVAMVAGMLVLLALAAGLPLRCGSWRAEYGHPYIGTQESSADDEHGDGHSRQGDEPGSPQPRTCSEGGRTSPILHHGHGTAHHRAVGSNSSSRPGTAVSINQAAAAAAAHRKSFSGAARNGGSSSSSSSRLSSSGAVRKGSKQLLGDAEEPAVATSPLLTPPGAHTPAGVPSDKAAPGRAAMASGGGAGAPVGPAGHLTMRSVRTSQMLLSLDFWLLFVQFTVASGVCLAYLNNLGQLVVSLGGGHEARWSLCRCSVWQMQQGVC